jgi:hypothetical protein
LKVSRRETSRKTFLQNLCEICTENKIEKIVAKFQAYQKSKTFLR